jgi:PAS domain S-box-containing protein
MVAIFAPPPSDHRFGINGARNVQKTEAAWKRFILIHHLREKLRLRKLRRENNDILKDIDDTTVATNVSVPKTLAEALPRDINVKNKDKRAIVVTEATGKFNMIGCNKAWENLCGFAECEIIGKDSSVLQGPDTNFDGLRDAVSRLFEGEKKVHVVTTNYKKDGTKFRNFLTLAPLKDEVTGKVTHFCAILNDVGDIYRRRKIRQDNEKILKEALDDITVGSDVSMPTTLAEALPADIEKRNKDPRAIVVTEASGKFNMIGCNKAWENLCGFAECEIVGKDSSVLQGPDTNFDGLRDAVSRLFEGEKKVHVVTTNYTKDGTKFTNFLTLGPLKDEVTGKVTHFVAILNDIGENIKARNQSKGQ